jgi:hypothetical protein
VKILAPARQVDEVPKGKNKRMALEAAAKGEKGGKGSKGEGKPGGKARPVEGGE